MSSCLTSDQTVSTDSQALNMKLEPVTNGHQTASKGHNLTSNGHHLASNGILKLEDPGDLPPALPPRLRQTSAQIPGHNYANDVMGDHYEMIRDVSEEVSRWPGHVSHVPHVSRCRQRVASPCRDDYKDFSALRHREMISPCRSGQSRCHDNTMLMSGLTATCRSRRQCPAQALTHSQNYWLSET